MKLVRAQLPEGEFALPTRKAKQERKTVRQYVREALRAKMLLDKVDPKDPIWTAFPLVRSTGRVDDAAENHDRYLYGSGGGSRSR
ncbi:MAG: hypothetical protein KGJ23_12380 [Euryarchaeota archaeon]|nr:hypothetical protein [Euryarchaeota archaeon]MDE1837394.1 hypothetical protein [Euryarchaeota archaeon]MDE1881937.1 hypothetical protein [Euryarchaeota archaeon]MDE2045506.1 hypothetical protein [Thermoplasmata archaeon]